MTQADARNALPFFAIRQREAALSLARAQPEPAHSFAAVFVYDAIQFYPALREPADLDLLKTFLPLDLSVADVKTGNQRHRLTAPERFSSETVSGRSIRASESDIPESLRLQPGDIPVFGTVVQAYDFRVP
jgi:hypothetical protein